MKRILFIFILTFIICAIPHLVLAQGCAACKASVESDLESGGTIARGLNTGILYLMAIPYLILMLGAYFFFKKPIDAKVKAWKERTFPAKAR